MHTKNYYNVKIIKPVNEEIVKSQYTEAVFKIIKGRISTCLAIDKIIKKLECDRSDQHEGGSNL